MMVVADPRLKTHRTTGRLDPAHQTSPGQREQDVIDGLGRHRPEPVAGTNCDLLDREMTAVANDAKHR